MKDFIDNIDWNKNIIFLILYMSIIVLCVYIYLTPVMDSYKSAIMEYRKTNVLESQLDSALNNLQKQQEVFLSENIEVFKRLAKEVDSAEIKVFASNYLKVIKISDLGIKNGENGTKIHRFKLEGKSQNLAKIKDLIANISTLPNITHIAFPLTIRKNASTFFIELELWIYSLESNVKFNANLAESNQDSAIFTPFSL